MAPCIGYRTSTFLAESLRLSYQAPKRSLERNCVDNLGIIIAPVPMLILYSNSANRHTGQPDKFITNYLVRVTGRSVRTNHIERYALPKLR
jgi:hypothetical protein